MGSGNPDPIISEFVFWAFLRTWGVTKVVLVGAKESGVIPKTAFRKNDRGIFPGLDFLPSQKKPFDSDVIPNCRSCGLPEQAVDMCLADKKLMAQLVQ